MRKPYPTDLTGDQWHLVAPPTSRRPAAAGGSTSGRSSMPSRRSRGPDASGGCSRVTSPTGGPYMTPMPCGGSTAPGVASRMPCGGGCGPSNARGSGRDRPPLGPIASRSRGPGRGPRSAPMGQARPGARAADRGGPPRVAARRRGDRGRRGRRPGGPPVWAQLPPAVGTVYADRKYHNYRLYGHIGGRKARYMLRIVSRPPGTAGWVTWPRRWVVERTLGWLGRSRRHSRDCEKQPRTSEAFVRVSCIHHMLNRPRPGPRGLPFKYRKA